MFKIPTIERAEFYADLNMRAMQEFAREEKVRIDDRWKKNASTQKKERDEILLNKRKDLELQKIRNINFKTNRQIRKITSRFPKFGHIQEIYIKLIDTSTTPVKEIETALQNLNTIANNCDHITQLTETKIKRANTSQTIGFLMKKFLGKYNSLYNKNKTSFLKLREAAKFMNRLPTFEELYTVAIAGFPNVGKSTLMKAITGSDVEIQNYPFTTKGLMFGYLKYKGNKQVQLIDTPGLLGRKDNNSIEKRAQIVLNGHSDLIVFVLDITESCGFGLNEQLALLKNTAKLETDIVLYLSKTDIFNEEDEDVLDEIKTKIKKFKLFREKDEVKKYLLDESLKRKQSFDPKKLRLIK